MIAASILLVVGFVLIVAGNRQNWKGTTPPVMPSLRARQIENLHIVDRAMPKDEPK